MSRRKQGLKKHHIIPRSRGGHFEGNIAYVRAKEHALYHSLFDNRTPEEIVDFLNARFWNRNYVVDISERLS